MFSALVCVYEKDQPFLLENALRSIYEQDLSPEQVVLVQDGPISSELKIIISNFENILKQKKIVYNHYIFPTNVGHGKARSKGIEICIHDIVAICDADDVNLPNRFSQQFKYLKENLNVSVVGSHIKEFTDGRQISIKKVPTTAEGVLRYCRFRCPMNQMTVMFRRKDVLSVGGYKDFYHNEDYFLWIRLIKANYQLANIPEVLVNVNVDPQTFVRRGGYRYFWSELKIQMLLLRYNISNILLFVVNVIIRIFIQLLIPSSLRQVIFKKFFRS